LIIFVSSSIDGSKEGKLKKRKRNEKKSEYVVFRFSIRDKIRKGRYKFYFLLINCIKVKEKEKLYKYNFIFNKKG